MRPEEDTLSEGEVERQQNTCHRNRKRCLRKGKILIEVGIEHREGQHGRRINEKKCLNITTYKTITTNYIAGYKMYEK